MRAGGTAPVGCTHDSTACGFFCYLNESPKLAISSHGKALCVCVGSKLFVIMCLLKWFLID